VTRDWRRLHNEELHHLQTLRIIIIRAIKSRRMGRGACIGEMRSAYNILDEKPGRKRPLRTPTRKWKDNIKMDLRETEWEGVEYMRVTQDRDQGEGGSF
jgi:hypothetical protein